MIEEQQAEQKQVSDQDLKQKMKELENKKRKEAMASAPVSLSSETISFDQWWILLNMTMKLRPHMKEIFAADFKARGLSKQETKEKFDATLKIFGL